MTYPASLTPGCHGPNAHMTIGKIEGFGLFLTTPQKSSGECELVHMVVTLDRFAVPCYRGVPTFSFPFPFSLSLSHFSLSLSLSLFPFSVSLTLSLSFSLSLFPSFSFRSFFPFYFSLASLLLSRLSPPPLSLFSFLLIFFSLFLSVICNLFLVSYLILFLALFRS